MPQSRLCVDSRRYHVVYSRNYRRCNMKRLIFALMLVAAVGCAPKSYDALDQQVKLLTEQNEVIAAGNRLFICTDNRDWSCVRTVFAPEVLFDMSSLGGQPGNRTPQQITDMWEQGLKSIQALHHQAGNYQVTIRGNE